MRKMYDIREVVFNINFQILLSMTEFVHDTVPSPQRVSCECSCSLIRLFLEKNVTRVHSYDINLVVKQPWDRI